MDNDNLIVLYQSIIREFFKRAYYLLCIYSSFVNFLQQKNRQLANYSPRCNKVYLHIRINVLLTELYPTKEVFNEQASNSVDLSLDIDDYLMAVQKMSIDGILDDFQDDVSIPNLPVDSNEPSNGMNSSHSSLVPSPSPNMSNQNAQSNDEDMSGMIMEKNTNVPSNLSPRLSQSTQRCSKPTPAEYNIEMKENQLPCSTTVSPKLTKDSKYPIHNVYSNLGENKLSLYKTSEISPSLEMKTNNNMSKHNGRKQYLSKILFDDYIDEDLDEGTTEDLDERTTISSLAMSEEDETFDSWDNLSLNTEDHHSLNNMSTSFKSNRLSRRRESRKMHNSRSESDVRSLENSRLALTSPKDVSLLTRNSIPFSYEHVASCSNEEFRQMRLTPGLSNAQVNILIDARRRATNRQAAERCRRIKVMAREQLMEKLKGLKNIKNELMRSIASARQTRVKLKDELYDEQKRLLSALTLQDGQRLDQTNWRVHVSATDSDQPSSSSRPIHEVIITPALALASNSTNSAANTQHQKPSLRNQAKK